MKACTMRNSCGYAGRCLGDCDRPDAKAPPTSADHPVGLSAENAALLKAHGWGVEGDMAEPFNRLLDAARAEGRSPCPEGVTARIGPDPANPNNRRVYVGRDQWCKVYGFDAEQVEARAQAILAALSQRPAAVGGEG